MTATDPRLPPLPPDGTANPSDYPDGIEWEEPEIDQWTGKTVYVSRMISVAEWNRDYALDPKEIEALRALREAEAAKPFRFVEPEALARAYGNDASVSQVIREMTNRRGAELEALLDRFKGACGVPVWAKRHLRRAVRLLLAELAVARQSVVALRQRVAELEADLKVARGDSAEAIQRPHS